MHRGVKMKKIIAGFICLFVAMPAFGATLLRVDADKLQAIVQQYFTDENAQINLLTEYNNQLSANNNQGIPSDGMWKVCQAGGLNIEQETDKNQCIAFVTTLMTFADGEFYAVCDGKEYEKIPENVRDISVCDEEFFNWTQVQVTSAISLAQEYAHVKWNDNIVCSQQYRQNWSRLEDYIQCKSLNTGAFYEFKFDDVRESTNEVIADSIASAICRMYGGENIKSYVNHCRTDEQSCTEMNTAAQKFGYSAVYDLVKNITNLAGNTNYHSSEKFCFIQRNTMDDANQLRTMCGLSPFEFCSGVKVGVTPATIEQLRQYTANACGVGVGQIECNASSMKYTGLGCASKNANIVKNLTGIAYSNDVISCSYGDQIIDYVFEEASPLFKTHEEGGLQALGCYNADGVFDGTRCIAANEQMCNELKSQNAVQCPDCKDVYWDGKNCVLGSAKASTQLQKGIKIGTVVVAAVGATVATVATGGMASGTWVIVANIATGVGAATVITSEAVMTYGKFGPFAERANECLLNKDAACAERLLRDEIHEISGYKEEFTKAEQDGLDDILQRLIELIPDDSTFWDEFFNNPHLFQCNMDGTSCAPIEKTQFWQVMRSAGNVAMIIGGLMQSVNLTRTENIIYQKAGSPAYRTKIVDNMRNHPDGTMKFLVPKGDDWNVSSIVGNANIPKIVTANGYPSNITRHNQLMKYWVDNGIVKSGDVLEFTGDWKLIVNGVVPVTKTVTNVALNTGRALNAAATAVAVGAGNLLYHDAENAAMPVLTRPSADDAAEEAPEEDESENTGVLPVPVVLDDIVVDDELFVPTEPIFVPQNPTVVEPIVAESVDVESVVEPVVVPEPQPGVSVVTPTPTPDKPVTPYSVPENKSGRNALIATAAVLGAVGTGFLIGGLVGGGDDDENRNANVPSLLDEQLNTLMNNANGVLGRVDNNIITLARLQTLSGTYAPIVNISGRAVIAVIYAGHYLPYYMDASAGRWVPLLGIGNVGGWFNTYPQNPTGITVIDQITNILNQQLLPNTVRQFIGINATGAQFPGAATGAYSIINAEFPNGVVQSNSGTMSSGDQQLYDNNYQRIKNLFVTAQLGGFFIV